MEKVRVRMSLSLEQACKSDIDFLVFDLDPVACLSELKVLVEAVKPKGVFAFVLGEGFGGTTRDFIWTHRS